MFNDDDCMGHLQTNIRRQLFDLRQEINGNCGNYLNLKSLTKISLKEELISFIQSLLTSMTGRYVQVSRCFF